MPLLRGRAPTSSATSASRKAIFGSSDATIDWNGRGRPADQRNPAIFWRERIAGDSVNAFHIEAVEGLGQDRVRLTGYLLRDQPGTDVGTLRARFGQIWIRGPSGL